MIIALAYIMAALLAAPVLWALKAKASEPRKPVKITSNGPALVAALKRSAEAREARDIERQIVSSYGGYDIPLESLEPPARASSRVDDQIPF